MILRLLHLYVLRQVLWGARPERPPVGQARAMLDRGLVKLVKSLTQMLEVHPW
jgi:hypothetical protein